MPDISEVIEIDLDGEEPHADDTSSVVANKEEKATTPAEPPAEPPAERMPCVICLEGLGAEGPHRPACLKCGHIFGLSCISKWLKVKSTCPQCNARARVKEVTPLYNLPVVGAVEGGGLREELQQQLQEAEEVRRQQQREICRLKAELQAQGTARAAPSPGAPAAPQGYTSHPPAYPPTHLLRPPHPLDGRQQPGPHMAGAPHQRTRTPPPLLSYPLPNMCPPHWPPPGIGRNLAFPARTSSQPRAPQAPTSGHPSSALSSPSPFAATLMHGTPCRSFVVPPPQVTSQPSNSQQPFPWNNHNHQPQQQQQQQRPSLRPPHPSPQHLTAHAPAFPAPQHLSQPPTASAPQAAPVHPRSRPADDLVNAILRELDAVAAATPAASPISSSTAAPAAPAHILQQQRPREHELQHVATATSPAAAAAAAAAAGGGEVPRGPKRQCLAPPHTNTLLPSPASNTDNPHPGTPTKPPKTLHAIPPPPLEPYADLRPSPSTSNTAGTPTRHPASPHAPTCQHSPTFSPPRLLDTFPYPARCSEYVPSSSLLLLPSTPPFTSSSTPMPTPANAFIRAVTLAHPSSPQHIPLPTATAVVHDIVAQPHQQQLHGHPLVLAAAHGAGLLLLHVNTASIVASFQFPNQQVWSCAWDPRDPCGAYAGLSGGCTARLDIRMPSRPTHLLNPPLPTRAPIHTIVPLPASRSLLLASSAGVFEWLPCLVDGREAVGWGGAGEVVGVTPQDQQLGTCESIVVEEGGAAVVASYRSNRTSGATPRHHVMHRVGAQGGVPPSWQVVQQLGGHSSSLTATRTALLQLGAAAVGGARSDGGVVPGSRLLLASADEDSCTPWLWDVRGGPPVHRLQPCAKPVLHLKGVCAGYGGQAGGPLLFAVSGGGVQMYSWLEDAR